MEKVRILIADDHDLIRKGISSALKKYPIFQIVGEAIDGPSLLPSIQDKKPDCVLVDLSMPNFDPISSIKQIRYLFPKIKILIVTVHNDDTYLKSLLKAGADGYYLKEGTLSDLRLAIGRIMMGEQWISSSLLKKLIQGNSQKPNNIAISPGQLKLLNLLQQGLDNKTIANRMNKSIKTIENNLTRLYHSLNVQSRLEAVNYANQNPELYDNSLISPLQKEKSMPPLPSNPITILLVDDNNHYRHEFKQSLVIAYPHSIVFESKSIVEAITQAKTINAHLAFVDMILDRESGIDCTQKIKAVSPNTRVILMSAYPDREFHRLGVDAGALAFVDKKDLDIGTLRQIIIDVIN